MAGRVVNWAGYRAAAVAIVAAQRARPVRPVGQRKRIGRQRNDPRRHSVDLLCGAASQGIQDADEKEKGDDQAPPGERSSGEGKTYTD